MRDVRRGGGSGDEDLSVIVQARERHGVCLSVTGRATFRD